MAQADSTQGKTDSGSQPQPTTPGRGSRPKRPRRKKWGLAGAVLALVALAAVIPYYLHAISHESTDDAFIDGSIISVSPRVAGHVARVWVTDNQKVKAGDLLVELDPRDFQARLDAARATLHADEAANRSRDIEIRLVSTSASAGLNEAEAAVVASRAALDQVKAESMAAEAKYQQAAQDLRRYEEMARSNTISPQQLDHAKTAERMAATERDAAGRKVAARQAQLQQSQARMTTARSAPMLIAKSNSKAEESKADVEKSRAEVEQATLNLSYTNIRAPADGYVTRKNVDPGAFVQVGQSLMAIVSPQVWVTANFKETQLTRMHPGQPATVKVDAYPDATFHGRVDSIQRGTGSRFSLLPPENATGNYVKVVQRIPVKIVFDQSAELAKYQLVPGMSVIPEVDIKAEVPPAAADKDPHTTDARSPAF
jgi:membrane fusion protein, multidrug efflux system